MNSRGFGRWGWIIQLMAFVVLFVSAVTANAYTVSGTVTNSSGKTGSRVYISLNSQYGGDATYGVSIPAPAAGASADYTIRGVQDGDYVANAFLDRRTTTSATHHANDPIGSSQTIFVAGADATNANITLTLPDLIESAPVAPTLNGVIPGPGTALVIWDTPANNNGEIAYSYNVYWHTSNSVSPTVYTGKKTGIPARDDGMYIQTMLNTSTPLADGTTLWYVVTGQFGPYGEEGSVEGPASNTFGPVTIGAVPSGGGAYSVSGTANIDPAISINGPLLIAVYTDGPGTRIQKIDNPGISNPFTVTGLPNGNYWVFPLVDQNNDGVIWTGDYTVGDRFAPAITVNGADVSGITSTIPMQDVESSVTTSHYIDATDQDGYGLGFNVQQAFKQPVNVTVLAGQDVAGPVDLAVSQSGEFSYWLNDLPRPDVSSQYTLDIGYSDGTSGSETVTVTAVLDSFADPVSPKGNVTFNATPMFIWDAPASPPAGGFSYSLNLNGNNLWWDTDRMPSSQTSALFNFNNWASSNSLSDSEAYTWEIAVNDVNGNEARKKATFFSGGSISGTVKGSDTNLGVAGIYVQLYDGNGNYIPSNNNTMTAANGSFVIGGLQTGTYRVCFWTNQTGYASQCYDNKDFNGSQATNISVTYPNNTALNPITLVKSATITGTVTASGGSAIQGISVQLRDINGNWIPNINSPNTDSSGNFTLGGVPSGTYKLYFDGSSSGYIGQWYSGASTFDVTAGNTYPGFNAQLAQGATITGRVTSNGTTGIQGISAQLRDINDNWIPNINSPSTDPSGNFTISGIPSGTYKLYFDGQSTGYIGQWYNGATTFVVTAGSTSPGFSAQLAQGASISGRVTSNGTTGIQGISVQLRDINGFGIPNINTAMTDPSGNFTMSGIPSGTYKLYFDGQATGYIGQWYNGETTFDVTAGNSYPGFNAQLAQGASISGMVTNGASGIQNISVQLYNSTGTLNLLNTNTDGSGGYQFSGLQAGTYKVCFTPGQTNYIAKCYNNQVYNSSSATDITVNVPGGNNDVNATLTQGGGISGQVTNGSTGIQNISVEVRDTSSGNMIPGVFSMWTDFSGNYTVQGIPAGSYKVYFNPSGTGYGGQWYNGKTAFATSDSVLITAGLTSALSTAILQPTTVPGAPTIDSIIPGYGYTQVYFTPPASDGGLQIWDYTVSTNSGNISNSGSGNPITLFGLTNGQNYTISVTARNNLGYGPAASTFYYLPWLVSTGNDLHTSINTAATDGVIWTNAATATVLTSPLSITKGVTISGGYNFDYSAASGYTIIPGRVNITGTGFKVIFKNIKIM